MRRHDISRTPLALLAAVGVTAGLTTLLARPARHSTTSTRRREAFITYLREHLAGSDLAIRVVYRLNAVSHGAEDGRLFQARAENGGGPFRRSRSADSTGSFRALDQASSRGRVRRVTERDWPVAIQAISRCCGRWKRCRLECRGKRHVAGVAAASCDAVWPLRTWTSSNWKKAVRQWEAIEERRRDGVPRTFAAASRTA